MSENARKVLEVRALKISYGRREVVGGASLAVGAGEVHALLGRNGSGKTSLVRCLLGQQQPDEGEVLLFGASAMRERARLMARVGVTPEEPNAPPHWPARALAAYCRPLYPVWRDLLYFERLERWGIDQNQPFGKLSRGQKSLVHLALALACEPDLLILDDPTLGLDAVARRTVLDELIGELAESNVAIFLTSHDFAAIEGLATHVSLLHQGKIVLAEEVESLRARSRRLSFQLPDGGDLAGMLAPFAPLDVKRIGRGVEALVSRWDEAKGRELAERCGPLFSASQPGLENTFIALAGGAGERP
jgi:ABC-2 type transport system ATP-binding protein